MENKNVLNEEHQLLIEQKYLCNLVSIKLPRLSTRDAKRLIMILISPETEELTRLKSLKHNEVKMLYEFCSKLLSIKYAKLFKTLIENRKKEEEKK